uniref:Uncharacterized protein n=1 Tax=Cacopsylla melanoneura TaxID=428564 RepID=A0A8D8U8J8_9HEMI
MLTLRYGSKPKKLFRFLKFQTVPKSWPFCRYPKVYRHLKCIRCYLTFFRKLSIIYQSMRNFKAHLMVKSEYKKLYPKNIISHLVRTFIQQQHSPTTRFT